MIFNMIAAGGGSGGRPMAYGMITGASGDNASISRGEFTISGLPFRPVILFVISYQTNSGYEFLRAYDEEQNTWHIKYLFSDGSVANRYDGTSSKNVSDLNTITDTGVTLKKSGMSENDGWSGNGYKYWWAFGPEG